MKSGYKAEADDGRLIDTELLSHACAFAAAADTYMGGPADRDWKVLHFLMGRSMELALKAFVLHSGAGRRHLEKLGHDLQAALKDARARGLIIGPLSEEQVKCIGTLSMWYRFKYLEYPLVRIYAFPRFSLIRSALESILASAYIAVHSDARYMADKGTKPGLAIAADYGD